MDAQNIVVTGASRGLGESIALRLSAKGHRIFALARTLSQLEDVASRAEGEVVPMAMDVTDPDQIKETYAKIESDHGPIHVLVNNAAVVQNIKFVDQDLETIDSIIDINLKGTMYCTRLLLPYMIPRKQGRIINVSSVAGTRGIPGQASYCASKHGMVGFGDTIAQELIEHNILVTTICPGAIDTPLWDPATNPYPGDLAGVIQPDELAGLVEFLLAQPTHTLYKRLVMFPTNEWH